MQHFGIPLPDHKILPRRVVFCGVSKGTNMPLTAQESRLLRIFNLSLVDKKKILDYQGNVCAICKRPMNRPNVDHRHSDGLVRGCLCSRCNRALGRFGDSLVLLIAAVEYLTNPPATAALGAPRYGLPGRVDTKKQRRLAKRLRKQQKLLTP